MTWNGCCPSWPHSKPRIGTVAPMVGTHCGFSRTRKSLCSQPVAKPRACCWGSPRAGGGGVASPWSGSTPGGAQRPAAKSLFVPSPGSRRQGEKLSLPPARRVSGRCRVKGRCASFLPRSRAQAPALRPRPDPLTWKARCRVQVKRHGQRWPGQWGKGAAQTAPGRRKARRWKPEGARQARHGRRLDAQHDIAD